MFETETDRQTDRQRQTETERELKARNPNYSVEQINVIMDVLGGMSMTLGKQLTAVIGSQEAKRTIRSMQMAVLAHSVPIKNLFKMQSTWTHTDLSVT